jgi:hypothetical protein
MSNGYEQPSAEDIIYTLQILADYNGAALDEACRCCKTHPIVSFYHYAHAGVATEMRGCIACDAIHLWPEIQYDEDRCEACEYCGGCVTHGCQCPPPEDEEYDDDDVTD